MVGEPEVFVLVSAAAGLSPQVVVLAVEPGVVFVAVVSVAGVAEPHASVDIAVAFDVLVPVRNLRDPLKKLNKGQMLFTFS